MRIAVGCDPNATAMKEQLIDLCESMGHQAVDMGAKDSIYAHTAFAVARQVAEGKCDRGILICGTGIGMCIAANKVKGAYAALISDVYSAERSIKSNDCNIACLGAFTLGDRLARELIRVWLDCEYIKDGPSQPKVDCFKNYDIDRT